MALDTSRISAVLFDIDGTLRDTDDELIERAVRAARRITGEARARRWARIAAMRMENPLQHALSLADRFGLDGRVNRLVERLAGGDHGPSRLTPGARAIVAALTPGYRLGVVSAGPPRLVERFLGDHALRAAMEVVVTGQTCRRTKPHPEPVLAALAAVGIDPSAAVMVGDTPVDILAGRRAGAQTVGVLTGFGERAELERAGADLIVETLAELQPLLT